MIPTLVEFPYSFYETFLNFALSYSDPEVCFFKREVIGFLYGHMKDENILKITAIDQMHVGRSVDVEIPSDDVSFLERVKNEEYIAGWIHSHPSYGLFLSSTDIATQRLFERQFPEAIAIVIDPTLINKTFHGMKAFKLDEMTQSREIKLKIILDDKKHDEINFLKVKDKLLANLTQKHMTDERSIGPLKLILGEMDLQKKYIGLKCSRTDVKNGTKNDLQLQYSIKTQNIELFYPKNLEMIKHTIQDAMTLAIFCVKSYNRTQECKFIISDIKINSKSVQCEDLELTL